MNEAAALPATRPARALFVATILVGSFLLFLIQPMVARMALPQLGGAPNVWNSAMIVYQSLLLAGYAYAHWLSRRPVARQALIHLALLAGFAIMLPIGLYRLPPPAPGWEVLWVPLLFLLTVGPVFFIVSAQAPLMQRWFAADPQAGEPWALYAASNLGSFAGLIAYPLLAEPLLPLARQSLAWSLGYAVLIALVAACAWARRGQTAVAHAEAEADVAPVGAKRIALWLALSAVPSGLMLSTTTHLTTDIFAMPLLWVIPLGVYLISFVIAFADNRAGARAVSLAAPAIMLLAGGLAMISRNVGGMTLGIAGVVLLFAVATALHARLYDARPAASQLTLFYLVMSLGGALGGAFTAIAAPAVFDWVWEHPILVLAAAFLLPLSRRFDWRGRGGLDPGLARVMVWILLALAMALAWWLHRITTDAQQGWLQLGLTAALTLIGLALIPWRPLFVAVLVMLLFAQGGTRTVSATYEGLRTRSYFGIYTVLDYPDADVRMLIHGSTLHGQQFTDKAREKLPTGYYGPDSGAGLLLPVVSRQVPDAANIGVVGLGTGTLACYAQPGQRWSFFEIDPAVLAMSRDWTFTYLGKCAPRARVVLGDARLKLAEQPRHSLDALLIDAFSSDTVPLHLVTEQAFDVYLDALAEDGVLLVHISNRYVELEPVIAAIARSHGLVARVRNDNPADRTTYVPSSWVALSRDAGRIDALVKARRDAPWEHLQAPAQRPWTDDFASILPYIRWDKLLGDL